MVSENKTDFQAQLQTAGQVFDVLLTQYIFETVAPQVHCFKESREALQAEIDQHEQRGFCKDGVVCPLEDLKNMVLVEEKILQEQVRRAARWVPCGIAETYNSGSKHIFMGVSGGSI